MNDDNNPTLSGPSARFDELLDAAQDAILSAKEVFVRPRSRQLAAKLRQELFGEPTAVPAEHAPPAGGPRVAAEGGQVDRNYERTAHFALNVMVGLVQRRLEELGANPGDHEAIDLVTAWCNGMLAGNEEEVMILSSMHMAIRARPLMRLPDLANEPRATPMDPDQWRAILTMLAKAAPARRPRGPG